MNFEDIQNMVITGDAKGAESWTNEALEAGISAKDIIDLGLIVGMDEVGRRFKAEEYYMPEVLISARAMTTSMNIVRPLIAASDTTSRGRVVIGTVHGDLHDIGKNLVRMMFEGAGYDVRDLGVDVTAEAFVKAVEEKPTDLVCLSALLTTTMDSMDVIVKALEDAELRTTTKVMVGGAPLSDAFAQKIGADAYAPDAAAAVETATELISA
ncbi:MAG TPA: corrinoid protein [Dehalococcoidia bacterium]|jgi:5-methyltetrahydrofolate--homocysteine methyltransferase|nr:cobalamin-binding protein [Chloroflexota bacterium]MDP6055608.1 corrinoid protein [Dehalococcoidia bacterium]MDP7261310.1 corrinoid protein [Dehalococcoidia bacterium]MDP7485982.1 corrinoid protein [Dehalococcoidia bacterium]HJP27243.1 corrinoid protein [Dehalococcoidia bacterium]|tara:strand:- start:6017 stop:6649 length:633 start_codon:yes stop_codon:yes gene_type:complete